jgi:uncharacterized protein YyaL (SSP411 family)
MPVVALLKSKYLPVRVDQDANPDLSSRYGDWGWPATIIFAADGTEIVKWRGYLPPERMAALLQAVIEDPSPGPSVVEQAEIVPAESPLLDKAQRAELLRRSDAGYDTVHGGFGPFQRFIDTDSMDLLLTGAEKGDPMAAKRARQTLDAALALIDREWGGIYQYSDALDWSSPHYEKIMWYQANGLRQYVQAYALWKDPRYLAAAEDLKRFLLTKLRSAEGAFYTSQDADIDETMPGKSFYALSAEERAKLGREPRIDTHIYARENGWAMRPATRRRCAPPSAPLTTSSPIARSKAVASAMARTTRRVPILAIRWRWGRRLSTSMPRPASATGSASPTARASSSKPSSRTSKAVFVPPRRRNRAKACSRKR